MSNITEQDIEQYIRFPESQSDFKKAAVKEAIANSEELRELADFFRDYDAILKEIDLPGELRSNIINLELLKFERDNYCSNRLLLAAQTNKQTSTYDSIATLASEDDETLIKILDENKTDKYQVDVISNRLAEDEPCILSLPEIGTDLIIDQGGKLTFEPDFNIENYDWERAGFALRIPVEEFVCHFDELDEEKTTFSNGGTDLSLSIKDEEIVGEILMDNSSVSRVLVTSSDGTYRLVRLISNSFSLPVVSSETLNVWLFE